jgi:riboflavin kinase/FMN adenylyltransferase
LRLVEKTSAEGHYQAMQLVTGFPTKSSNVQAPVVALGNFDGVHRGHAAVLAAARDLANNLHAPLGMVTFEPHPRQILCPGGEPFRLTTAVQKARILESLGVDLLYVLPFDRVFASLSAWDFEETILRDRLKVRGIVAGEDFLYGHERGGSFSTLRSFGERHGISVVAAPMARDERGEPYSSTRIRQALIDGRPDQAASLLGRAWEISFTIVRGDQRGRALGYSTANGSFGELLAPRRRDSAHAGRRQHRHTPHVANRHAADRSASVRFRPRHLWRNH